LSWECYYADILCFIALMQLDIGNAWSPAAKAAIIVAAHIRSRSVFSVYCLVLFFVLFANHRLGS
jgi:hypothetical protein